MAFRFPLLLLTTVFVICSVTSSDAKKRKPWDKPFNRGGALSIDKPTSSGGALSVGKPFESGGALSIGKPFDKGGDLSINKVYVPPKFRIGRVKSLAEVIIPLCWGAPQDCRGTYDPGESNKAAQGETSYPYYVIGRFLCTDRRTGMRSGKSCDVVKNSSQSCQHALDSLNEHASTFGDPCTLCAGIRDESEYWDGLPPDHVQGGPCSSY